MSYCISYIRCHVARPFRDKTCCRCVSYVTFDNMHRTPPAMLLVTRTPHGMQGQFSVGVLIGDSHVPGSPFPLTILHGPQDRELRTSISLDACAPPPRPLTLPPVRMRRAPRATAMLTPGRSAANCSRRTKVGKPRLQIGQTNSVPCTFGSKLHPHAPAREPLRPQLASAAAASSRCSARAEVPFVEFVTVDKARPACNSPRQLWRPRAALMQRLAHHFPIRSRGG